MTDHQTNTQLDDVERAILTGLRRAAYDREALHAEVLPFMSPRKIEDEVKAGRLRAIRCGTRTAVLAIDAAKYLAALRRASDLAMNADTAVPDDAKPRDKTNRESQEALA
jgi:hypothetical protein